MAFSWQLSWSRGCDGRGSSGSASRRRSSLLDAVDDDDDDDGGPALTQHDAGTKTRSTGRLRLNHALLR